MDITTDPAASIHRHFSSNENDIHHPNTILNLSTLNQKYQTSTNMEDSSSCEVNENQQATETSISIVQCRNRKTSLMDDLENGDDDNVNCQAGSSFQRASLDEASPGEILPSELHRSVEPITTSVDVFGVRNSPDDVPTMVPFRHHLPTHLAAGFSNSGSLIHPAPKWDSFARSGARLKSLLVDAIGEVKYSLEAVQNQTRQNKRVREDDDEHATSTNQRTHVTTVADFSAELAREKTAQVLQLKRVCVSLIS
jgi:hypothetical protein